MQPHSVNITAVNLPRPILRRNSVIFAGMGWMEVFIFSEFLLPAVLFVPGTQAIRTVIRVLPYLFCAFLLLIYRVRVKKLKLAPGSRLLVLALMLLALELLHPESALTAGLAQCAFQVCIALPLFWGAGMVQSPERLRRLLWLMLLVNGLGGAVGLLQAIYPQTFLPPEFSAGLTRVNPNYIEDLSYIGASGQKIVRPPGLTDLPGSAALAGLFAGVLGLALASEQSLGRGKRIVALACAFVGITDIYLAQVRSLLWVLVSALVIFGFVRHYRTPMFSRRWLSIAGLALVCGSFYLAVLIGGDAVSERFLNLKEEGVYQSYQTNRGAFVEYTLREELWKYPLGAGIGRWGMMNAYFGGSDNLIHPNLYAEIQITGWLYDGGLPMWLLYGGAIMAALVYSYRVATRHPDTNVASLAKIVLVLQLALAGSAWGGPTFNTQLGVIFWLLTSGIYGAASFKRPAREDIAVKVGGQEMPVTVPAHNSPRSRTTSRT